MHQYAALDDEMPDEDAQATAQVMLADKAAEQGLVLAGGVTRGEGQPVAVNADMSGWEECAADAPEQTGWVYVWTGWAVEPVRDPKKPLPGRMDGEAYVADLPPESAEYGGAVRVRHGLGGPVTVYAHMRPGHSGNGILFAQPITDDEEHVEVFPGVASLRITRDPEDAGD